MIRRRIISSKSWGFPIPHMHLQALAHGILIDTMFSFAHFPELFRGLSRQTPSPHDDLQPATEIQLKLGTQVTALKPMACHSISQRMLDEDSVLSALSPLPLAKKPWFSRVCDVRSCFPVPFSPPLLQTPSHTKKLILFA